MRNVPHSGTEPWRNKQHNQVWSFQTPNAYPFELDSPRHLEPYDLRHSQYFSPSREFKRSVFTQNLSSSVTRCGRRGRRSLIRSTVMGLHASVLLVWCHHSLWTTRQSSQCQCSNTFTQLSRAVYTRKLNKVELQWAGFWFLFYSKVMELWATAVGRDNETSGSTRPRKGLNLNRPIKRAPWWRQRQVWLHTLVWLNLFLLTFPHLSPSALDQLTMNSLIPQTTSILKWIFRPVALLFHVTSVKNLLVPQQEHFLSLHILV